MATGGPTAGCCSMLGISSLLLFRQLFSFISNRCCTEAESSLQIDRTTNMGACHGSLKQCCCWDCSDEASLIHAARGGDLARVQSLLAVGTHGNCLDSEKWGPLHHAAFNGHSEVVRVLAEACATAEACSTEEAPCRSEALLSHTDEVQQRRHPAAAVPTTLTFVPGPAA